MNVLILMMDAARAQSFSAYGYKRKTSPHIDSFLDECMVYENAISSSYWTLPSISSLFTGTYSSTHKIIMDGEVLPPDFATMAKYLNDKGYGTAYICNNPFVSSFSGLNKGFEKEVTKLFLSNSHQAYSYIKDKMKSLRAGKNANSSEGAQNDQNPVPESKTKIKFKQFLTKNWDAGAQYTNKILFKWIKKHKQENKNFFGFVLYGETHAPYRAPDSYIERHIPNGSNLTMSKIRTVNQNHVRYFLGDAQMSSDDFERLKLLYDGSITYLDKCIYDVYSFLKNEQILDDTILIITADHGENLGEHGLMSHKWCLYDTLIHVPLIIRFPSGLNKTGTDGRIVQHLDLFPTICDVLDDDGSSFSFDGNSLYSDRINNRSFDFALSELFRPMGHDVKDHVDKFKQYNRQLISIRTNQYKYIHASNGTHEFYDLKADPNELNNIIDSGDANIQTLKNLLQPFLEKFENVFQSMKNKIEGTEELEADDEVKDRLKALGYM